MIIVTALWKRIWPYIAVVGAVLASLFAVRQSCKAAGKQEAKADQTAKAH